MVSAAKMPIRPTVYMTSQGSTWAAPGRAARRAPEVWCSAQPCRPSHLVDKTTVVRVRATPLIRFNALMVASSAGMSVTRTLST